MLIPDWWRGKRSSFDNDLEIIGVAATNVPAKPLRSEGIRSILALRRFSCRTFSCRRSAGVSVQLALAGGRDSCRVYRGFMFLNSCARRFLKWCKNFWSGWWWCSRKQRRSTRVQQPAFREMPNYTHRVPGKSGESARVGFNSVG